MSSVQTVSERMNQFNVCVIIPTYNNHKTLRRVIDGVLLHTSNVIVVNDGSTDSTGEILQSYPQCIIIDIVNII